MWEKDHREGWALQSWWFWTVVLEKNIESPLDCKEVKPVNLKGNQPWIFKLQYFGHLMWKAYPLGKTLMLGKTETRRRRGWQRMRWLDSVSDSMDTSLRKLFKIAVFILCISFWCSHGRLCISRNLSIQLYSESILAILQNIYSFVKWQKSWLNYFLLLSGK